MAGKTKKESAGLAPERKCAPLQEQTIAMNERLIISSMRQHELTEAAQNLNAQLQAEITEHQKTEAALHEREIEIKAAHDYAQAILRTAPVPLLVLRADLRVNSASEAFYSAFKVAPAATEGRLVYEIGDGQWDIPKLRKLLEEIIPQKNVFNGFEVTHEFETIGTRTMLLNARRVDNAEGVPERILLAIEDITERKHAEEALRVAMVEIERASRAKDEFLAALSHELRTPLTPVLLSAAALQQDDRLPQDVRDQLVMMERNIGLEARLIDDMLDLSRIAHGKLLLRTQPCDAHTLIALAVEMVRGDAQGKRQTMEIDLAAGRSHLIGDPARLQQVFWNLLKNAVKFTPESGRLSVRSRDKADRLALEISDSGIGISPESIERIFLPFEQAGAVSADHRFGGLGLGLGLSIAKAILDLHGGSIQAKSSGLGQGATFHVELPATAAPLGATPESISQPSGDLATEPRDHRAGSRALRLLLVEDHQSTLDVLERLLTRAGHRVTTATSVAGALGAASAGAVDAVISDLGLPDGTGFELMRKLRSEFGLRGIALSGYGMDEDLRRSHEGGFDAHLTKPIDFVELERALEDLMTGASAPLNS